VRNTANVSDDLIARVKDSRDDTALKFTDGSD
jgi:hypothetical protein